MTSLTKFYHVTQIILYIWSYDQSLVTLAFQWEKIIATSVLWGFDQLKQFFHGCPWFRFSNVGLGLGMAFTFCTIVKKRLKLEVSRGLIPTFVEVTGEKLVAVGVSLCPHPKENLWGLLLSMVSFKHDIQKMFPYFPAFSFFYNYLKSLEIPV